MKFFLLTSILLSLQHQSEFVQIRNENTEIHENADEKYLILKNHVFRKGVIKEEECVDISDIEDVEKRLNLDEDETSQLLTFEKVTKNAIKTSCPNFKFLGQEHVDDIKDVKFTHLKTDVPMRIAHGEHPGDKLHDYIVYIKQEDDEQYCYFEYSQHLREKLQSASLDSKLPHTYAEMEYFFNLQSGAMEHYMTHEPCSERGVVIFEEGDHKINMTNTNKFTDSIIARASCSRLCLSRETHFNFVLKNSAYNKKIPNAHPCKFWSFVPEDNFCYLHEAYNPEVSKDYRRLGSVYGQETYKDYNSIHGTVGCIDKYDSSLPFVKIGQEVIRASEVCRYLHTGETSMTDMVASQCFQDFLFRSEDLNEQNKIFSRISELLKPKKKEIKKRFAAILPFLTQVPSVLSWISRIVEGSTGNPHVLESHTPQNIYDSFTYDKHAMFQGLLKGLGHKYAPKHVQVTDRKKSTFLVPDHWSLHLRSFSIDLLRNRSQSLVLGNVLTKKVNNNWLWDTRRHEDKKELEELEETITEALHNEQPITDLMSTRIAGKEYIFASFVEDRSVRRLFMVSDHISEYPDTQYLGLGLKKINNLVDGQFVSGKTKSSNLNAILCLGALSNDESPPKQCYKENKAIPNFSEFTLFTKDSATVVIRMIVHNDIVQVICLTMSDVIYSKGILVLQVSKTCTIKLQGQTLRNGDGNFKDTSFFGFKIIYNDVLVDVENFDDKNYGVKWMEDRLENKSRKLIQNLQSLQDGQYELGPIFDIVISAIIACVVFGTFIYKMWIKYCN